MNNNRRRISVKENSDEKIDITNTYENFAEIKPETEYSNSQNDDLIYHLKGIEENDTYSNITEFDLDILETFQAKLEGSQVRKLKFYYINEKDLISNIIESENVTFYQPDNDSNSDLTEDEEKLKSGIYNDDNEVPRNDSEFFHGKDDSFNISSIRLENSKNIFLNDTITNKTFIDNLFKYFNKFNYTRYNSSEKNDLNLRFLKYKDETKKDFSCQNNNSELEN